MNGWPVELISYVFGLACADDGSTVRSLSLTSKPFREIARPFLFQSLVISTTAQLITLLERLRETPIHLRHIRHLFLSINHEQHLDDAHDRCTADASLVISALQLVAGHLQTLTLVAPCPLKGTQVLSYLFRISFPHLEELTIAGLYAFSFQTGNFPRLRYLHFAAGNKNPCGLFQFGALDRAFPKLTSLRVSGLSKAVSFTDELGRALENAGRAPEDTASARPERISPLADATFPLPPRLERIYVQCSSASPSPVVSRAPSRSPSATNLDQALVIPSSASNRQKIMVERLADLGAKYSASSENRAAVQLVVLDGGVATLKQDWLDRLDGKDGAWIS